MGSIIFLPGILGSELSLDGVAVWPPTPLEVKLGYGRTTKLVDPRVVAGSPIRSVACFGVYAALLDDLEEIATGNAGAPRRSLHPFGYDWRLDLEVTAADIARRIDALPAADLAEIRFVGHSMGCLVIRLILESGTFDAKPWFGAIKSFTALAGPHQGATTALVRAMGLEGSVGLSGPDIKQLSADTRYPSLYQLLPAPGIAAVLDGRANRMAELDFYDPAVAARLGLSKDNLATAEATHKVLARNRRPSHVEYVYLAGSGNDTWLRVDVFGAEARPRKGQGSGDGTVPLWSAVEPSRVHHAAPAAHDKVFENEQLRTLLYFTLGARPAATAFMSAGQKPLVNIVPAHSVYQLGKPIDLMLVPAVPARTLDGHLTIAFNALNQGEVAFVPFQRQKLAYQGDAIERLSIRLDPLPVPGFYRIGFEGSHDVNRRGAAMFGVSDTGGASGE
jgi:hypothetical protein